MYQPENTIRTYTCPDCGSKLASDRDLLRCEVHGAFFVYGPQLLVRAARENGKHHEAQLPWEKKNGVDGQ